MSTRRTRTEKDSSRDEGRDPRSKRSTATTRDHRPASPYGNRKESRIDHDVDDDDLVSSARKEPHHSSNHYRSKHRHRPEGLEDQRIDRFSPSFSRRRDLRGDQESIRTRARGDEQTLYERKYRHHSPARIKRPRSRSPSSTGERLRKHRRTRSRSPQRADSPNRTGLRPRRRSRSPDPSPGRTLYSRKRKTADGPDRAELFERSRSPRRRSPARSPSRSKAASARYREDSLQEIPHPRRRERLSPRRSETRHDRRSSPARRGRAIDPPSRPGPDPSRSSEFHRRSNREGDPLRLPSPRRPVPRRGSRPPRRSPESPSRGYFSRKIRNHSPSPRRSSAKAVRGRRSRSPSPSVSPSALSDRRGSGDTMSDAYKRSLPPRNLERSSYRRGDLPTPSPPRPIPSLADIDDRRVVGDDRHLREAYSTHNMKSSDHDERSRMPPRPSIDTRHSYSSAHRHLSPLSAHQGSPQSASVYDNGRNWGPPPPGSYAGQHSSSVLRLD